MIAPAGRRLGKYEILRKLGRGGMADVYLAQDSQMSKEVALKLIEHGPDADTRDSIEAERRGAQLQARLAAVEPHVARVFAAGDIDGFFYVAMEYVDGQDLAELMRHGPLVTGFATEVAAAVAETLDHAHHLDVTIDGKGCHGIVHGDVKPKNVRITSHGDVRLLDFGIAKALSLSRRLTRNEFGSVPYASPERLDSGQVDATSDLWSLGVMLYEMVTGLQPYQSGSTELLERMIRSRIPPPAAPDPCPESLRRIMAKALAADPAQRYQTAREFAADLAAFRAGGSLPVAVAAAASAAPTSRPEDSEPTRRTSRPEPALNDAGPDPEATVRTAKPQPAPDEATRRTAPQAPVSVAWPPKKAARRFGPSARLVAAISAFCFLYGGCSVLSSFSLYGRGQQLEKEIASEQLTDPDQIWNKWTELSSGHASSVMLQGPRQAVRQKQMEAAERVIAKFRSSEAQPVYEKDWEHAQTELQRALELGPDDTVRGDLRVCEGHIALINGLMHHDARQLQAAEDDFDQAERLLPKSPDAELGLARLYVYNKDVDKTAQALDEAQKVGYQMGNRDKLQLAAGYRSRGDSLFWDSRKVRGLPQERDQVGRAADDYKRALELYQAVAPYGNASDAINAVELSLEIVNFRLHEIEGESQ